MTWIRKKDTGDAMSALDRQYLIGYERGRKTPLSDAVPYYPHRPGRPGDWQHRAFAIGFDEGRQTLRDDVRAVAAMDAKGDPA